MPLNSILDSAITRRLARYLEMSDASSGFSDVVVKDGHITVHHAFAKLSTPMLKGCAAAWRRWRRSWREHARLLRGGYVVLRAFREYERGVRHAPRARPATELERDLATRRGGYHGIRL